MNSIILPGRLQGVDPRQLRALLTVVETQSFREAATRLGYAQSAVSHQIKALEQALGTRLLERGVGRREVRPTEAGTVACAHARRLIAAYSDLAADFEARARGDAGLVRIGVFQTAAAFLLAQPLGRFHSAYPSVQLRLIEGGNLDLRARLVAGDLDLSFDCDGEQDSDVELLPLVDDPWVVITQRDGHFAQRTYLDPRDLDARPLIAWQASDLTALDASFAALGVAPTVIFRTDDNVALTRFVAAGIADACIGSLLGTSLLDESLLSLPLRGRIKPRRISLALSTRRRLTPVAQRLADEILAAHGG